ncbi:PAS domain-containing protein [Schnuerera sp. xch1]|uniref:DUF438 domain-containing protein n=1 Tax=Schnuerera sp. xch1 TaxID=2874283 RepID=UPI001CC18FD8|nr:PAS domain-containing protein [Schnuerera sp. xch1]MBZ2174451.1 PAS domain-containing protein [Schnuerera sp. xch1]
MNKNEKKVERLKEYVQGVLENKGGKDLYTKYKDDIESVTPQECFEIFYSRLERGYSEEEILNILDKVINVFYKSLNTYKWRKPEENSFLYILIKENEALEERLDMIKKIILNKEVEERKDKILTIVQSLKEFDQHYQKEENILFPYMEKKMDKFNGLSIMWSLHDEARERINRVIAILESDDSSIPKFNVEIGKLFFAMLGIVKKENLILFPSAMEVIDDDEWDDMNKQSTEYGFPFIETPNLRRGERIDIQEFSGMKFKTDTGELNFEQLLLLMNALPADLTFVDENNKVRYFTRPKDRIFPRSPVDENNKVRYFTRPKDRIFPRSPAVIGRDVENCHPPKSLHVVNKIVEEFRNGNRDSATFWIEIKGRKILIQYFALRNSKEEYKGVLEVTQDITEIQKLEGEKRLLDW